MKGVLRGDNFVAALGVAEPAGQFEQSLVCLRAAVAKKDLSRRNQIDQRLGQASLRFGVIKVRDVNQFARLLDERSRNFRMGVAEATNRDAAAQVEIAPPGDVVEITARAVAEREVESRVTRDDVFLKQRLDRRRVIAHDRRRWRNDFFHFLPFSFSPVAILRSLATPQ